MLYLTTQTHKDDTAIVISIQYHNNFTYFSSFYIYLSSNDFLFTSSVATLIYGIVQLNFSDCITVGVTALVVGLISAILTPLIWIFGTSETSKPNSKKKNFLPFSFYVMLLISEIPEENLRVVRWKRVLFIVQLIAAGIGGWYALSSADSCSSPPGDSSFVVWIIFLTASGLKVVEFLSNFFVSWEDNDTGMLQAATSCIT